MHYAEMTSFPLSFFFLPIRDGNDSVRNGYNSGDIRNISNGTIGTEIRRY
jgi:hypothetical protein